MLYQLSADERTDVRMIEYVVERIGQVLRRSLARRHRITVQQRLGAGLVMLGKRHHRAVKIDRVGPLRARARQRWIGPTGEHRREALDGSAIEGRNRRAAGVQLLRTVRI